MANEYFMHQIKAFVTYFSWCDLMTREENLKAIIHRKVKFISEFIKQKWLPHCNLRLLHFQWNFRFYGPAQSRSHFFGKSKVSVVTDERQVRELNKSLLLYIAQPNFGQFERLEMHSIGCLWRLSVNVFTVFTLCSQRCVRKFRRLIVQFHLPFDQSSLGLLAPSNSLKIRQIVNIQSVATLRCWRQSMRTSTYFRLSLLYPLLCQVPVVRSRGW